MKDMIKKLSDLCKVIFGYGIMTTLFSGVLVFFAYVVALIIGGESAVQICHVVYKQFVPVMIYITSVLVLLALVAMYLAGELALTPDKKPKSK